ncbi:isoprenylcysteine carboxylmethyltransferase family protein [Microvirga sp. BT689]|uniref:methyltransferase family protein n=1 Tax=Microvirga arvi TaxID=2778731 RepID=UPI0019502CD7|nr:isoprenylcysteine carboxylmethyltransferase family protein [Microvirga arvi]MBM6583501.1 isoprenylcysteine carboxylmethyltransferase family protein [Microvirga arvi]
MHDILDAGLTASGSIVFGAIAWAVRGHFVSDGMPAGMRVLSALSLAAFVAYLHQLWALDQPWWAHLTGFALQAAGLALFLWAIRASREQRLALAFDDGEPLFLLRQGPYRYIRHPFYASYLVFWSGCSVATLSPACTGFLIVLGGIYTAAALGEERRFGRGPLRDAYGTYARSAGLFWPKPRGA